MLTTGLHSFGPFVVVTLTRKPTVVSGVRPSIVVLLAGVVDALVKVLPPSVVHCQLRRDRRTFFSKGEVCGGRTPTLVLGSVSPHLDVGSWHLASASPTLLFASPTLLFASPTLFFASPLLEVVTRLLVFASPDLVSARPLLDAVTR